MPDLQLRLPLRVRLCRSRPSPLRQRLPIRLPASGQSQTSSLRQSPLPVPATPDVQLEPVHLLRLPGGLQQLRHPDVPRQALPLPPLLHRPGRSEHLRVPILQPELRSEAGSRQEVLVFRLRQDEDIDDNDDDDDLERPAAEEEEG